MSIESTQTLFIASIAILAVLAIARPHWLLRPSFAFACLMSIVINPAAAFAMKPGYPDSPLFDSLRLSSVIFPLGVVVWVLCTPFLSAVARKLHAGCQDSELATRDTRRNDRIVTWLFLATCVFLACWYFATIRVESTGLWAILFDTGTATQARENSLKLLESSSLKYAFSIGTGVIAPITLVLLAFRMTYRRAFSSAGALIAIIGLLALIGITGARMPIGRAILALAITVALTARTRSRLLVLPAGVMGALAIAASLTLLRSGKGLLDAGSNLVQGISNRLFALPFETGLRSVEFAAERGFLDGANVRPFAILTGQEHVKLAREVYHAFYFGRGGAAIDSGSANTCFFFDFQAAFGIWSGWWIALVAIGMLDFGLLAFRGLRGTMLPALLAVFLLTVLKLLSSAFTTTLLTGGLGLIISLAVVLPLLLRRPVPRWSPGNLDFPQSSN